MASQSFNPSRRLHYPWEYRQFFNQSQAIRLTEGTIFRIPNLLGHYRVGITIKARANSVERNRVKRLIREFFRTHEIELGSFDYNVVVPGSRKIGFPYPQRLKECLGRQFLHAVTGR